MHRLDRRCTSAQWDHVYHPKATRRTQRNGATNYRPSARKTAKNRGRVFLMAVQDIRVGGRQSNASYQYTLLSDDLAALRESETKIRKKLATLPELADVNSNQQDNGAEINLIYNRDTMARLGNDVQAANSLLNNAFGQRQISTIPHPMKRFKVVMEVNPRYTQDISALEKSSYQ
ncbi:efflux RND transporter permease subunit [Escherichia coli]